MATINYTVEHDVAAGYVKVEWPGLAGGDVGQAFSCGGLKIGSAHAFGNFNGNTLSFQGSNEVSPATFTEIVNFGGAEIRNLEWHEEAVFAGAVRPSLSGSGGSTTLAVILLAK